MYQGGHLQSICFYHHWKAYYLGTGSIVNPMKHPYSLLKFVYLCILYEVDLVYSLNVNIIVEFSVLYSVSECISVIVFDVALYMITLSILLINIIYNSSQWISWASEVIFLSFVHSYVLIHAHAFDHLFVQQRTSLLFFFE